MGIKRNKSDSVQENKKQVNSEKSKIERRTVSFKVSSFDKESRKMIGHAAVFGEPTIIGRWFMEEIAPGAFVDSIAEDDIRALWNHNADYPLGRSRPDRKEPPDTLSLSEDETGLAVSIDPPDTRYARDLGVSIERGDVDQMSFAFEVLIEEWITGETEKDLDLRRIKKAKLYDVSPVTFPAYEGTDIGIRSHETWKKIKNQELKTEQDEELEIEIKTEEEQKSAFELVPEPEEEKQPQFNLRIHKMRQQLNKRL